MQLEFEVKAKYEQLEQAEKKLKQFQDEYNNLVKEAGNDISTPALKQVRDDIGATIRTTRELRTELIESAKQMQGLSEADMSKLSSNSMVALSFIKDSAKQANSEYKNFLTSLSEIGEVSQAESSLSRLGSEAEIMTGKVQALKDSAGSLTFNMEKMASMPIESDGLMKLNTQIDKLTEGISTNASKLQAWDGSERELQSAANDVASAQERLSQMIDTQANKVEVLRQQVTDLALRWREASGTDKIQLGILKEGASTELANQSAMLEQLRLKSEGLGQTLESTTNKFAGLKNGINTALEQAGSATQIESLREHFYATVPAIVTAKDHLSRYNDEISKISVNSEKIEGLRNAITQLDATTQAGAIAKLESEMAKCSSAIDQSVSQLAKYSSQTSYLERADEAASQAIATLTENITIQKQVVSELSAKLDLLKTKYTSTSGTNVAAVQQEMQAVQQSLNSETQTLSVMQGTLSLVEREWGNLKTQAEAAANGMTQSLEKASEAHTKAGESSRKNAEELKNLQEEAKRNTEAANALTSTWKQFLGTIGVAAGIKGFISQLIQVNATMEQTKTAFYGIIGNTQAADNLFSEIKNVSSHSAIGLGNLTSVAQQFIAMGESASKVPQYLEAINQVSMGSEQRFNNLASALEMMAAMGQVNTRTIRTMIRAGFNPLITISNQTGESVRELMEKVKKGTVPVSQITDAFLAATKKGGQFYGMNEKMSQTLSYQFAIMKKNVAAFFLELGKGSDGTIKGVTSMLVNLTKHLKEFAEATKIIISFIGLKGGIYLVGQAFQGLSVAIKVATGSIQGMNAAMAASGWGTIIALVGTATMAIYDFATSTEESTDAVSQYNKAVNESTGDVEKMFTILENTDKTSSVHEETLKGLVDKYGEYGISIDTSKGLLKDEANITEQLIDKKGILIGLIRQEAEERAKANQLESYQKEKDAAYDELERIMADKLKGELATIGKDAGKTISEGMAQGMSVAIIESVKKALPEIESASTEKISGVAAKKVANANAELLKNLGATIGNGGIYLGNQVFDLTEKNIAKLKLLSDVSKITGIRGKEMGFTFVNALTSTAEELDRINGKERDFLSVVNQSSEGLDLNSLKARNNALSIDELGKTIQNLLINYGENDINFRINVDDAQVPKWMKGLGLSSDGYKKNAAFYTSTAQTMAANRAKTGHRQVVKIGGKIMSESEVLERAAQYMNAASQTRTQTDVKPQTTHSKKQSSNNVKNVTGKPGKDNIGQKLKDARDNYESAKDEASQGLLNDYEYRKNELKDDGVEKSFKRASIEYGKSVLEAEEQIEKVAEKKHTLEKVQGKSKKTVAEIKKDILSSSEDDEEYGELMKAFNQNIQIAGQKLLKSQQEIIDGLSDQYDKSQKERTDRLKRLKADIESMLKLAQDFDKQGKVSEASNLRHLSTMAKSEYEWLESKKSVWNEYYKKYGNFLQKTVALKSEYEHDTMTLEVGTPERTTRDAKYKDDVSSLAKEEGLAKIDWVKYFGSYAQMSEEMLEKVKQQLIEIIELDERLSDTDKTTFIEQLKQINDQQSKNKSERTKDYFGGGSNWITTIAEKGLQREILKQNVIDAQNNLSRARGKYDIAVADKDYKDRKKEEAANNLDSFLSESGSSNLSSKDLEGKSTQEALQMFQNSGGDMTQLGDKFKSMFSGFQGASAEAAQASTSVAQAEQAMQGAESALAGAEGAAGGGGGGGGGAALAETIIKGVNQNVQSLNELVKKFGDEDSDFAKGMNDFAESSNEAVSAFDSLKSGDFAGVVLHLSNAFESLGSSISHFLGYDGGERDYKNAVKRYEKLSGIWDDLIDKKKEYINLEYGSDADEEIKSVQSLYKAEESAIKKVIQTWLAKRTWNAHSQAYRNTQEVNKLGGFAKWSALAGVDISSIEDLYNKDYDYDELVALKAADNGEFWASLQEEMRDYLDKLIDCKESTEDFAETAKEKLTGIKFDDLASNFMDTLEDMNASVDDFVSDFTDSMRKALVDNSLGTEAKAWLEDFTERYQQAVTDDGGTISQEHAQAFREELTEYAKQYKQAAQAIAEASGLGEGTTSDASTKGYATASEESIAELSGRALAANEALYSIRDLLTPMQTELESAFSTMNSHLQLAQELQESSYLELIEIRKNTGVSSQMLTSMKDEIVRIRKKVDNV